MSIVLKDWYGKDQIFDHNKIFVRDENGELVQFTKGTGGSEQEMNEILMYQNTITGFTANGDLGGLYTANCPSELADFEIVPGQEYVVLWDDVGYSVIAQDASAVLPGTLFMGNGSALGLNGNGEPFAIGYSSTGITFVSYDTTATHSVGIIKRVRHQDLLLQDIEITENGEYSPGAAYDGFGKVLVDVPASEITLQDKTITENGEYTADAGFDGLGKILVEVAGAPNVLIKKGTINDYENDGLARTINHGLGAIPDIIMFFPRSGTMSGTGLVYYVGDRNKKYIPYNAGYFLNKTSSGLEIRESSLLFTNTSTQGGIYGATETKFEIPAHVSNCRMMWIAISGLN